MFDIRYDKEGTLKHLNDMYDEASTLSERSFLPLIEELKVQAERVETLGQIVELHEQIKTIEKGLASR